MPIISISNLGSAGIITDLSPWELPLPAWSGGKNVRFTPNGAEKVNGSLSVFGTVETEPLFAAQTTVNGAYVWVYAGETKAYVTDGVTHNNITRQVSGDDVDYSANPARKWSGGNFNGLVVMANGIDVPQVWFPNSLTERLVNMPNWPSDLQCKVIRPFGNFLVALNLTVSNVEKPTAYRWSHPADPGAVPASWDISDPTKDAGENYLNETAGACVDLVPLRGDAVIYKTDSCYRLQLVEGMFIFKQSKLSSTVGIPTKNCAVEFRPGVHLLWTGDDVVMFDGQRFQSVANQRIRKRISGIDDRVYQSVFLALNNSKGEVWMCVPEDIGNPCRATKALIFNWESGAWGERDLGGGKNFIASGVVDYTPTSSGDTWEDDTILWDSSTENWGESSRSRSVSRLLSGGQDGLWWEDVSGALYGSSYESVVERKGLGIPFKQNLPPDISSWKFCLEIWPRFTGDIGTVVEITIGASAEVGVEPSWGTPQNFTIGVDTKVNCTISGRLFAIRVRSVGLEVWTFYGYDLNVKFSGSY